MWLQVCVYVCVQPHQCEQGVNGGLASKRQGNEWSHSVCGPLASAVERRGGGHEWNTERRCFSPLMALLVMDETASASFRGSSSNALWEAGFISLISIKDVVLICCVSSQKCFFFSLNGVESDGSVDKMRKYYDFM